MKDFIFVSGNLDKVRLLERYLGQKVAHHKINLTEIQSLEPHEVVEHKAREAYRILQRPVLIEDTALSFTALGRLPGPFVKFFLSDVGNEGLCKLLRDYSDRSATASVMYGFYDGTRFHTFNGQIRGTVPPKPRGNKGMGWDPVFIPEDSTKTYAEMSEAEIASFSVRNQAVKKLKKYLEDISD